MSAACVRNRKERDGQSDTDNYERQTDRQTDRDTERSNGETDRQTRL